MTTLLHRTRIRQQCYLHEQLWHRELRQSTELKSRVAKLITDINNTWQWLATKHFTTEQLDADNIQ